MFNSMLVGTTSDTSRRINRVQGTAVMSWSSTHTVRKKACVGNRKPTLMLRNDHAFADSHSAPQADWSWVFAFRSETLLRTYLLQTLLPTADNWGLFSGLSLEAMWNKAQPKYYAIIAFGFSIHSTFIDWSSLWTCWHQFEDKLHNVAWFLHASVFLTFQTHHASQFQMRHGVCLLRPSYLFNCLPDNPFVVLLGDRIRLEARLQQLTHVNTHLLLHLHCTVWVLDSCPDSWP